MQFSCFSKIQIGFIFLVPAHPGSPGKMAIKRVCVLDAAFLVKYLEQCSVKLGFVDVDASFVFHVMMDVGITLPRLLDVYDHLFKSRVSADCFDAQIAFAGV